MADDKGGKSPRVALVTGAAGAVGRAVARRMMGDNWRVAGVDLKPCDADLSLACDVTDRGAMIAAAGRVHEKLGPIALLVTAAGDFEKARIGEMAPDRWQRMLDVWLGGTANACAAVVPGMLQNGCGSVVTIAVDASRAESGLAYVAAAAGTVVAFAKSFACEVAPQNVKVNCIAGPLPLNPDGVASTVNFLVNDGDYYAGQVFFPN